MAEEIKSIVFMVTKKKIYYHFLITSMCFTIIGILTMTFSLDTLINNKLVGATQVLAGILGVLQAINILNRTRWIHTILSFSMLFRITSYTTDVIFRKYEPELATSAVTWIMLWVGFLIMSRMIKTIETLNDIRGQITQVVE